MTHITSSKNSVMGHPGQPAKIELPKGKVSSGELAVYRFVMQLRESRSKGRVQQTLPRVYQELKKVEANQALALAGLVWKGAGKPKKDRFGELALQGDPSCRVSAEVVDKAAVQLLQKLGKSRLEAADRSKDKPLKKISLNKSIVFLTSLRISLGSKTALEAAYKDLEHYHPALAKQLEILVWEEAGKPKEKHFGKLALQGKSHSSIAPSSISKAIDTLIRQLEPKNPPKLFTRQVNPKKLASLVQTLKKEISSCTKSPLQGEEIRKIIRIAAAYFPQKTCVKVDRNKEKLPRTLLVGPKTSVLLMTRCKKKGDKLVGEGAFKKAKFAIDLSGKRKIVAVYRKSRGDAEDWKDMKLEVELMQRFKGVPGIIQIDFAVQTKKKCYIVMEYCNGGDLNKAIKKGLSFQEQLQIAMDAAEGVKNLHAQGILHRDLKPGNIFLIREKGKLVRARVADLGLAQDVRNRKSLDTGAGTSDWYPPEKAKVAASSASNNKKAKEWILTSKDKADIWTLGAIFFKLFNEGGYLSCQDGHYSSDPTEDLQRRIAQVTDDQLGEEVLLSKIGKHGPELLQLIIDMLKVRPEERISMKQVCERLRTIAKSTK